jgi:hydrogenase maturation protein HypF
MAAAHLADSGRTSDELSDRISRQALAAAHQQIERRLNAPLTSSVGRLFDAVAAMAGVRHHVSHEGQAAMELEALAWESTVDGIYSFEIDRSSSLIIDTRPLIAEVADDVRAGRSAGCIGRRFHSTLVEVIARVCSRLAEESGMLSVVLSGGVFMNALLTTETTERLMREGFRVYRHQRVPPNDGGLCLGQLAVASVW